MQVDITTPSRRNTLSKLGANCFIASGILFFAVAVLLFLAGPPPPNGKDILEWASEHRLILALADEALFFAAILLAPALVAFFRSTETQQREGSAIGGSLIAATVPVIAVLDIVLGRLIYPVFGIIVHTPDAASFTVSMFYGGLHATNIIVGVATLFISVSLRREPHGMIVFILGIVAGVLDLVGAYPFLIGPIPTLICQFFFAAWFTTLGWRYAKVKQPIP